MDQFIFLLTGVPPCMGSVILTCEDVFCEGALAGTVAGTIGRLCTMDVLNDPA